MSIGRSMLIRSISLFDGKIQWCLRAPVIQEASVDAECRFPRLPVAPEPLDDFERSPQL